MHKFLNKKVLIYLVLYLVKNNVLSGYLNNCAPVKCKNFNIEIAAGGLPIVLTQRGKVAITECRNDTPILRPLFTLPKADRTFKIPLLLAIKVGFANTNNFETFLEFNYSKAKPKGRKVNVNFEIPGQNDLVATFRTLSTNFEAVAGYFGTRYYFNRLCNNISFFVGSKLGIIHYKTIYNRGTITYNMFDVIDKIPAMKQYLKTNTIIGGLQAGLDFELLPNLSIMLIGEILAAGPIRNNQNIKITSSTGVIHMIAGNFGAQFLLPIKLGIKYNF